VQRIAGQGKGKLLQVLVTVLLSFTTASQFAPYTGSCVVYLQLSGLLFEVFSSSCSASDLLSIRLGVQPHVDTQDKSLFLRNFSEPTT